MHLEPRRNRQRGAGGTVHDLRPVTGRLGGERRRQVLQSDQMVHAGSIVLPVAGGARVVDRGRGGRRDRTQRGQKGDQIVPVGGCGDHDRHVGSGHEDRRAGQEPVQRRRVPGEIGFPQRGTVAEIRPGGGAASHDSGQQWRLAAVRQEVQAGGVAHGAVLDEELFAAPGVACDGIRAGGAAGGREEEQGRERRRRGREDEAHGWRGGS